MKKELIFFLLLIAISNIKAQSNDSQVLGFHKHDGFYLSLSSGPLFGSITDELNVSPYQLEMNGMGFQLDIKIGGAISENLILHGTLISNVLPGPTIKTNNYGSGKASDDFIAGESMFGAGITYYIMPQNIFLSGTVGLGNFSIIDDTNNKTTTTQNGFSMQLKVGKEWWVSKDWGLGIGITYGKTNLTNNPGGGVQEKMDSNRFGILFNATFN